MATLAPPASAQTWPNNSSMHGPDITWQGRSWWVMDWSAYKSANVWIDSDGYLNLKQSGSGDSGVISYATCGFGNYTWVTKGVHAIDKNGVVGMYPYLSDLGESENWHEADIEWAKWGSQNAPNMDFWVQPNSANSHLLFTLGSTSADTTWVIDWERTYITFAVIQSGQIVKEWRANQLRDAAGVYACMNYWHYLAPTAGPDTVVFKSFSYTSAGVVVTPSTVNATASAGTVDNGGRIFNETSANHTVALAAADQLSASDYLALHWYYFAIGGGAILALVAVYSRHWLIALLGVLLVAFGYLYMTSGGVLVAWLTGTGLIL